MVHLSLIHIYSKRNLHYYIKFYQCFPDEQIVNACVHNLNWTHIRSLLRVTDENARYWYMKEAVDEGWSSRTLDRNISTQYYHRLLQAPKKEAVIEEMKRKTAEFQKNQLELIKSPVIAEFLGFKNEDKMCIRDRDGGALSTDIINPEIFTGLFCRDNLSKIRPGKRLDRPLEHSHQNRQYPEVKLSI